MALIDDVKQLCDRIASEGWRDLLLAHGLDMAAPDLAAELAKPLNQINRDLPGFEDFAFEGQRGIEPGYPARSLLYHALASPNVTTGVDGLTVVNNGVGACCPFNRPHPAILHYKQPKRQREKPYRGRCIRWNFTAEAISAPIPMTIARSI